MHYFLTVYFLIILFGFFYQFLKIAVVKIQHKIRLYKIKQFYKMYYNYFKRRQNSNAIT